MSKYRNDPLFIKRTAHFSPCRSYRYWLDIVWDSTLPMAAFIGLNPSTADEFKDDNTVRRCRGFSEREGCGGMRMLNLFAFRATLPKDMKTQSDPIGEENDLPALVVPIRGPRIACWGTHGKFMGRHEEIKASLPGLLCFGFNDDKTPKHPLYLPENKKLEIFTSRWIH